MLVTDRPRRRGSSGALAAPGAGISHGRKMADISADIATQAVEPQSVSADGQSASARPLESLIAYQQFADARAAVKKRRRGLNVTQLTTPGACDVCSGPVPPPSFSGY